MKRHDLGCRADRLLTTAINFSRSGGVGKGFRHGNRRRRQLGADLRGYSEESSAEAFRDLLRRRRRRAGLRSDAKTSCSCTNGSCASGVVLVLEATELGCLERGLLVSLAVGLREHQLFGRTVGLQAGFAISLGLEGSLRGLRSELGRAAASDSPLREPLRGSSSFGGSCLGSHKNSGVLLRNRSTGGGW